MKVDFVDLGAQYKEIKKKVDRQVVEIFTASQYILGPAVSEFEKAFADYVGVKHCIGLASGRDAITLSLRALGLGQGDEVITVANTFIASVYPIVDVGATPILVDIDPETYQIDYELLKRKITKRTKAILPVHLYGYPNDMDKLRDIAKKNELLLIEDACQAHGAEYKGRRCGSFGNIGCFSFYPAKNLGASGDAGAVVTNDDDVDETIRAMRDVGQTEKYKHDYYPANSRMDTIEAVLLKEKLKKLNAWNTKRRKFATLYKKLLRDLPIELPPDTDEDVLANYHLFVIRTTARDALMSYLKENQVYCGIHYPIPIHEQKCMAAFGYKRGDFPIAEEYSRRILSLPMHPHLTERQVERVSNLMHKFFKNR